VRTVVTVRTQDGNDLSTGLGARVQRDALLCPTRPTPAEYHIHWQVQLHDEGIAQSLERVRTRDVPLPFVECLEASLQGKYLIAGPDQVAVYVLVRIDEDDR
jgi:hypothetical protein